MFDSLTVEQFFSQFHFLRPWWLLAFVPMMLLLCLRALEDSRPSWKDVLPEHLRSVLAIGEKGWRKQLPLKLLLVNVTLAIIICAGPTWQREASPFGEDKASMLVVLDNSDSMLQKDLPPSRLERAKQKVRDLLAVRQGGRTGLIVYAGSAHVAMPVTQDAKVFDPFLAAISPDIMPVDGKDALQALALIDQQLNNELGSSVLLVSDGVTPNTIDGFEAFFSDKPYQLLILAVGNLERVSDNPMDLDSLRGLARVTGGRLVEVSVDSSDIETLNRLVDRNMQLNGESSMPWKDMGYVLLYPIALIMMLWFRQGWLVQWCVLAMVSGSLLLPKPVIAQPVQSIAQPVQSKAEQVEVIQKVTLWDKLAQRWWDLWLTQEQQGQRLMNDKQYLEAAKHFKDPLRKGTAYYYAGEYKLAHSAFLQLRHAATQDERDLGLYNAASALARQREFVAARNLLQTLAVQATLSEQLRPDVEHNLAVISALVDEINQMSESQGKSAEGQQEISVELGEEQPKTGDGYQEQTSEELMTKESISAEELLNDQAVADKWLKRVEADPKYFLRAKFQIQLQNPVDVSSSANERGEE